MKKYLQVTGSIVVAVALVSFNSSIELDDLNMETPIIEALLHFDEDLKEPAHYLETLNPKLVEQGRQLFENGYVTQDDGTLSSKVSDAFVCYDCHNLGRETESNLEYSPEKRLDYGLKNGLQYKMGATFWGVTDRVVWFSGSFIENSSADTLASYRTSLRGAVRFCTKELAKGRALEDWEVESLIHFANSLRWKMVDLQLDDQVFGILKNFFDEGRTVKKVISTIRLNTLERVQNTAVPEIKKGARTYGETGDPDSGKVIYNQVCMPCHGKEENGLNIIPNSKSEEKRFLKMLKKNDQRSLYVSLRNGLSDSGWKQYHRFSWERLSDTQIENLVSFIVAEGVANSSSK